MLRVADMVNAKGRGRAGSDRGNAFCFSGLSFSEVVFGCNL
jgi:hypothetical protein